MNELSKTYGTGEAAVQALKGLSLNIEDGELTAIIGASGSGKSTLLHILGGLDTDVSGSVYYDDTEITALNDAALADFRLKNIGFVFQFFDLIPELTAAENITLPQMMMKKKRSIPDELAERLGIADRLKHYPDELSGGQRQRVAIARALINSPSVLLCDEPTGNLDKASGREVMKILKALNEQGTTVIIVTHDNELASQCNRVIEISDGVIV